MALVTAMLVGQVGALLGGKALVGYGSDAIRTTGAPRLDSRLMSTVIAFARLVMGRLVIRMMAEGESFLRGLASGCSRT